MEARDIHATNVVSGSQYIQQQTIYQTADHPTVGEHSPDQQDRTRLLKALGKAYREALESSLQGVVSIRLSLRERLALTPAEESLPWQLPQQERLLPEGTTILDVYDDANTGLLILGAAGAGKSTLLYELAQALIKRAQQDNQHPIPVVLNLSLWAAKQLPLEDWIVQQLELRYAIPRKLGKRWQQEERWLLLLDGLDEVAQASRPACVEAINTYLSTRTRLISPVVCSRLEDYEALREPLRLPNVVVVQPLTPEQTDAYLSTAGPSLAAVREVVQRNPGLQELLTRPLMLNVVTLAYRDKAVADLPQLGLAQVQQRHIFASYLQRMLPAAGKRSAPSSKKMLRSLVWLAQQMRARNQSLLYLEQLQPDWLMTLWTQRLYDWLGVRLPAILLGILLSLSINFLFKPSTPSGAPYRDILIHLLTGGLLGGLLGSLRIREVFLARLVRAVLLGLGVCLLVVLIDFSTAYTFSVSLFFDGAIWGIGFLVLALMLFLDTSLSLRGHYKSMPMASTRMRAWKRIWTFEPLHQGLLIGALVGLMWGLSGVLMRGLFQGGNHVLDYGISYGLLGMLLSVLFSGRAAGIQPAEILVWSWKRLLASMTERAHKRNTYLVGLGSILLIGLSFCLRYWLMQRWANGLSYGLSYGLGDGLGIAVSYWLLAGLFQSTSSESFQEYQRVVPNQGIYRSFRNGLFLGMLSGGICMISSGLALLTGDVLNHVLYHVTHGGLNKGLSDGFRVGLSTALSASPMLGLAGWLAVFLLRGGLAWWRHWVLRILLWRSDVLPLYLVRFLDEAARCIILLKVGGGYRFIHDLLRDYLASVDTHTSATGMSAPKTSQREQ